MRGKPKKPPRQKDLTPDYMSGSLDEDRVEQQQRFSDRNKRAQQDKILRTAAMRHQEQAAPDLPTLPIGQVVQVYSLYCDVEHEGRTYLCVVRKTLVKVQGEVVVGDQVRFRITGEKTEPGAPDAVVEQILARRTVLTRSDSFKAIVAHPIVANAEQVLIVASLLSPKPKWGLIDRMIVAARAGSLESLIALNKIDLAEQADSNIDFARAALDHYRTLGIKTIETSVEMNVGIDELRDALRGRTTVLAGHSGVGKSSLIRAVQPDLDLRIGEISRFTDKGRHTTTSARRYPLHIGGAVIDTPGVKLFGLWNVTRENLSSYFPDVDADADSAPRWRRESYQRILASLPEDR
jgi:ribosome biogenesis GTPase